MMSQGNIEKFKKIAIRYRPSRTIKFTKFQLFWLQASLLRSLEEFVNEGGFTKKAIKQIMNLYKKIGLIYDKDGILLRDWYR